MGRSNGAGSLRVIGMVIYTYSVLEERLDPLWAWIQHVEEWAERSFGWFDFMPHARFSVRSWKATSKNRARLYERLAAEQPWFTIGFSWPSAHEPVSLSKGFRVTIISRPQPDQGESYRSPSFLYLEVHPEVLHSAPVGVRGLLKLGIEAWNILGGIYGWIDVETGIPLQDDIFRNATHVSDNFIPPALRQDFRRWQIIEPHLDKRVWKAFWGNLLGAEHLRQLGDIRELRRADPRYRLLPEYLERAYQGGVERLRACGCYEDWLDLANGGVLLTLSSSPLDWFTTLVQDRLARLQQCLGQVAVGEWDDPSHGFI